MIVTRVDSTRGTIVQHGYNRRMYAQCPACLAVFDLRAADLAAAQGRVRCGECDAEFDAWRTLADRLPQDIAKPLQTQPTLFGPPQVARPVWRASDTHTGDVNPQASPGQATSTQAPDPALDRDEPKSAFSIQQHDDEDAHASRAPQDGARRAGFFAAHSRDDIPRTDEFALTHETDPTTTTASFDDPDDASAQATARAFAAAFAARSRRPPRGFAAVSETRSAALVDEDVVPPTFARGRQRRTAANIRWLGGAALLTVVLAAEIGWAERARWIDNEAIRAWLDPACARWHCALPLRREADQLQLVSRDVRPHPSAPGALLIRATLRNAAAFAQAFPIVAITLSDLDANRIAMRRFKPQDYLADTNVIARGIGVDATTTLTFEVADPGRNAIAFEFKFE